MLDAVIYVASLAVVATLAWLGGSYWRTAQLARKARTDREFGVALLEALAEHWGAKLEMVKLAGPGNASGGPPQ